MSNGRVFDRAAHSINGTTNHPSSPQGSLKRKFASLLLSTTSEHAGYPSPPMSSPPSPPRQTQELSYGGISASTLSAPTVSTLAEPFAPASSAALPPPPAFAPQPHYPQYQGGLSAQPEAYTTPRYPSASAQSAQEISTARSTAAAPVATGPTLKRTERKSKAHVASACVNCKRAHLSCDVNRPCARCVAAGKQATCVDVQHKKRGRPRLRDESEFKIEQVMTDPATSTAAQPVAGPSAPRPLAATRHRRTESLRSLQSLTSDSSPSSTLHTPLFPPTGSMLPPSSMPPPHTGLAPAEVPTAYLDLDFVIIRANAPFRQIMRGGQEVSGMRIGDIAASADGESLNTIRNQLRAEREAREPTYMPPILNPGYDPLLGISDADIDRLSQSFEDRMYTWTRNQLGGSGETFPARIRLAKSNLYFVTVTLPTFRPIALQAPSPQYSVPSPTMRSSGGHPQRQTSAPLAPPSNMPLTSTGASPEFGRYTLGHPVAARSYNSPQASTAYPNYPPMSPSQRFAPPQPATAYPPMAEQPPALSSFTPRSTTRDSAEGAVQPPVQLPPLVGSSAGPSEGSSSAAQSSRAQQQQQSSFSDSEDDSGRKKRRRVGISDVLQ